MKETDDWEKKNRRRSGREREEKERGEERGAQGEERGAQGEERGAQGEEREEERGASLSSLTPRSYVSSLPPFHFLSSLPIPPLEPLSPSRLSLLPLSPSLLLSLLPLSQEREWKGGGEGKGRGAEEAAMRYRRQGKTHISDDGVIGGGNFVVNPVIHIERVRGLHIDLLLLGNVVDTQGTTNAAGGMNGEGQKKVGRKK